MEIRTDELRRGMRVRPMSPKNAAERVPFVVEAIANLPGGRDLYNVHEANGGPVHGRFAGSRIWVQVEETEDMAATATKKPTAAEEKKIKLREEILANTERVRSLAEAGNEEAVNELGPATDALIAQLPVKERNPLRKVLKEAAEAKAAPDPEPKVIATLETPDWTAVEGAQDLVDMGAAKIAEAVAANLKASSAAEDMARIALDIRKRIMDKTGKPDLDAKSNPAKLASKALYEKAGAQLKGEPFEVKKAVDALKRSVQYHMTEIRAEYMRSLDAPDADLAPFARALEGKPDDVSVSEHLSKVYKLPLVGRKTLEREAWQRKQIESGADSGTGGQGTTRRDTPGVTTTPAERAFKSVSSLMNTFRTASPEDFEALDDENKAKAKAQLEEVKKALNLMLAAVI